VVTGDPSGAEWGNPYPDTAVLSLGMSHLVVTADVPMVGTASATGWLQVARIATTLRQLSSGRARRDSIPLAA
jgi:hypothetical protein